MTWELERALRELRIEREEQAKLEAYRAEHAAALPDPACEYCDGTGRVFEIDGTGERYTDVCTYCNNPDQERIEA